VRAVCLVALGACSFTPRQAASTTDGHATPDAAVDAAVAPDAQPAPFALTGMQWEIDCKNNLNNATPPGCSCDGTSPSYTRSVQLTGAASEHWLVTVHVVGAMEPLNYQGGASDGTGFYVGGNTGGDGADNLYRIDVDHPAQHYFLNAGIVDKNYSIAFDYTEQIPIDGDAMVTFTASPQDTAQWQGVLQDGSPIAFAGVTTPTPTNGLYAQWAFVTVQSATPN
jgi:hypothetical protein